MKILNLILPFLLLLESNIDSSAVVNAQYNKNKINPNPNKNFLDNTFDAFGDMK